MSTEEEVKLPEGSKIILAPEKQTERVKKERTEAQKLAFEKMRAKRLENDQKRRLSKEESQKEMDDVKVKLASDEEAERLKLAEELKRKYGADVKVQQKRGRKPGQRIPYSTTQEDEPKKPVVKPAVRQPVENLQQPLPQYTNPYMAMLQAKRR